VHLPRDPGIGVGLEVVAGDAMAKGSSSLILIDKVVDGGPAQRSVMEI
jgi:hypothetical protein